MRKARKPRAPRPVVEYARYHGYDSARAESVTYKDCRVFSPTFYGTRCPRIGLPYFILREKGGALRMTDEKECFEVLALVYPGGDEE